jgi:hypothetical protein
MPVARYIACSPVLVSFYVRFYFLELVGPRSGVCVDAVQCVT